MGNNATVEKCIYSLNWNNQWQLNNADDFQACFTRQVPRETTVLKYFFTVANQYDGIIINPDTDKFKLSIERLFRLITNRIMTNRDLMKDFIKNVK